MLFYTSYTVDYKIKNCTDEQTCLVFLLFHGVISVVFSFASKSLSFESLPFSNWSGIFRLLRLLDYVCGWSGALRKRIYHFRDNRNRE